MKRWRQMAAIASAVTAMGWSASSQAAANVYFDVEVAPPPPRYEVIPPGRVGYVWSPGYWRWDAPRHRHLWHGGHYIRERHGEHWVHEHWTEHNGRYRFNEGHWERG